MAVVLCDVDEVVCPLNSEWFRRWNERTGDTLSRDDCTAWDLRRFVTQTDPDGYEIHDVLQEPDLYEGIRNTCPGAADFARQIRVGLRHRLVWVTTGNPVTWSQKFRWLQRHGLLPDDDHVAAMDYMPATDKSLVQGDVLIDDGPHNFEGNGVPFKILMDAPWNRHVKDPEIARVETLDAAVELIADLRL